MFTSTVKDDKTANATENLKDDVRRIQHDLREVASGAKDDLQEVAHEAGRRVHDLADQASQNTATMVEVMKTKMRDNPIQTGAVALGVGFVLGILFRR